ncbi:MMPL family transporter, partial [Paraburkholderia sp. BR14317]
TSLLGYAILTVAPFPALRQIACFAIVGIFTAFASVVWLLPSLMTQPARRSPHTLFAVAAASLAKWQALIGGRRAWGVALALVVIA